LGRLGKPDSCASDHAQGLPIKIRITNLQIEALHERFAGFHGSTLQIEIHTCNLILALSILDDKKGYKMKK